MRPDAPVSHEAPRRWRKGRLIREGPSIRDGGDPLTGAEREDAASALQSWHKSDEAQKRWHKGRLLLKARMRKEPMEYAVIAEAVAFNVVMEVLRPPIPVAYLRTCTDLTASSVLGDGITQG